MDYNHGSGKPWTRTARRYQLDGHVFNDIIRQRVSETFHSCLRQSVVPYLIVQFHKNRRSTESNFQHEVMVGSNGHRCFKNCGKGVRI